MEAPEPSRLGMMRVVIADAGPRIGLARIGCLDLLLALFGGVTLNPGVDPGERSTIALALHWRAAGEKVLVIMDDRCGRAEARSRGLSILGTAAVLVLAKEQRLIPACAPLLVALREEGYYLSDGLVAAVLAAVGEA
jgi:predicted nucleic acid-binding protein